jgi:uncharacterized protein YfaS (alpha-2-macroglobulin family)
MLLYTAHLTVYRPVEDVEPTSRGLSVSRQYFLLEDDCLDRAADCPPAGSFPSGEEVLVRITLVVPSDQYYVLVEDPFPAGAEPVDPSLLTAQKVPSSPGGMQAELLRGRWGWWVFSRVEIGDQNLRLFAEYLPAGTYQYTYRLRTVFPGTYRVLPPRAWALYFPEVYGQGRGQVIKIEP